MKKIKMARGTTFTFEEGCRFYGDELTRIFKDTTDIFLQLEIFASPYMHLAIIFFILISFDHWMRRSYFKQHKNRE